MSCDCKMCQRTRRFRELLNSLESYSDKEFLEELYTTLMCTEDDADWNRCENSMLQRFLLSEGHTIKEYEQFRDFMMSVDSEIYEMTK